MLTPIQGAPIRRVVLGIINPVAAIATMTVTQSIGREFFSALRLQGFYFGKHYQLAKITAHIT
jgi:hypothetical protein